MARRAQVTPAPAPVVTVEPTAVAALPASVRLLAPFAYFTPENCLRAWEAGHVETDPDEIADLIRRGASVEECDDGPDSLGES